jgi:hypothetical protein
MKKNLDELLKAAPGIIQKATIADIDRARDDPDARRLMVETFSGLRKLMRLSGVQEPQS